MNVGLRWEGPPNPTYEEVGLLMNVAVMKTKAETALLEQFERVAADLPGGDDVRRQRRAAIGAFAGLGLPHRRIEEWKYTDVRALLKEAAAPAAKVAPAKVTKSDRTKLSGGLDAYTLFFVNGVLAYQDDAPETGLETSSLGSWGASGSHSLAAPQLATIDAGAQSVLALNTAFVTDGAVLHIKAGAKLTRPIHLVFVSTGAHNHAMSLRNSIVLDAGAEATLIESFVAEGAATTQTNTLTTVTLAGGASLHHVKSANVAAGSLHLGNTIASIGANASYRPFQMTTGNGVARHQLTITFSGEHASFDLGSAVLSTEGGHIDTTMVIDHAVPDCTSRELYKCVLDGRARAVFQGKVIVRPDAQKTDGKQMARALLLSPDAEFNSKPELEIYADDVVCGHGTTSMELDDDLLFYCQSRGIPTAEARTLLVESFIGEAIDKVEHEALRETLMDSARAWLNGSNA
jgi:Fe-S cluster assembly protein SufD